MKRQRHVMIILLVVTILSFSLCIKLEKRNDELNDKVNALESQNHAFQKDNQTLKMDMEEIESKLSELKEQQKINETVFPQLLTLANQLRRARLTGDIDHLEALLGSKYDIVKQDEQILARSEDENDTIILYSKDQSEDFEDWTFNQFWYSKENDAYTITLSEYYGGKVLSNLYVVISFKKVNEEWKIISLAYDV